MHNKFSLASFRLQHLLCCAIIAAALAGCGGDGTAGTSAASPVINGTPPVTVAAGGKYQYIPSASAPDGRALSFDISNKPEWAAFSASTGELSGTPQESDAGLSAEIEIGVSDGTNRATVGPFRISITAAAEHRDRPHATEPSIAGSPATQVTAGQAYRFTPVVPAARHAEWSFAIVNRPAWARFNTATGELFGTPTLDSTGTFAHILISVSNGRESVSLPAFAIHVLAAANDAPTLSGAPPVTVVAGTAYAFTPVATDPLGRALTFAVANPPAWASFNTATGELSGTPPTADAGRYPNILISATDGILSAALPAFAIEVQAPANDTPTISGTPAASVTAGSSYGFTPSTTDPAGAPLVFSIQGMPAWASFSSTTGRLSGTPAAAQIGSYAGILISVSDGNESVALPAFSIRVNALPDHAPTISGTPNASVLAGNRYLFTPSASDPDGNALSFAVRNLPPWASFSSATGQLSGTPTRASVGSFSNIVISVSDGQLSSALPAFSIQVDAPAQAPLIGGTPPTGVVAGSAYAFTPSASDAAGSALTFSVSNLPSWASFNRATGQLSGTPTAANVGSFANIVISVSDGTLSAALPAFTIAVTAPAGPPTLSGVPARTVGAGAAYRFTPAAADPSGHALTFSVQNLPSWAAFNAQSGTLSGTPGIADVGSYANIVISVSDGTASASLAPFSISVTQAASASATLNWNAPTLNTDGSPLTNLAGFHIYYGTSAGNLNQSVQIANPGVSSYVLSSLAAGTWYFSVNAYTTSGTESALSSVASAAIP